MNRSLILRLLCPIKPALDLDFSSGVLDTRVSFSGGANGTYMNASGVIAASSGARFDWDPVTLACKGLLIEEARTNLLLNSKIDGTSLSTQSVTVANVVHTLSFYGTGTVTLSGTAAGAKVGTSAYPTRSTFTFTPTAGTLTLTVSGTVQFAQLEAGSFATSFTPTAGTTSTRTIDAATIASGVFFGGIFNAQQGAFIVDFDRIESAIPSTSRGIIGANSTYAHAFLSGAGGVAAASDGAAILSVAGVLDSNVHKVASAYFAGQRIALSLDGAAVVSAAHCAAGYTPSSGVFYIGDVGGGFPLNGHIKRIRYWNRQLSDYLLQRLTT